MNTRILLSAEGPPTPEERIREILRQAKVPFLEFSIPRPGGEAEEAGPAGREESAAARVVRGFHLKPREVRDYLDRFVVRQEEAKKVLAVAVCDHYHHVRRCLEDPTREATERIKQNIVLLGPTGVGKTYLVRCLARLIGVPFVKADATKFSETGYVGHDVEDLVRDLVKAANGDVQLAQFGIIYLDEIDKIASVPTVGRDVSGRGVQINLLKLMEETEVSLFSQTDLLGQMQAVMDLARGRPLARRTINTRHILFIVSGAFDRLADIVRKRVAGGRIGFRGDAAVCDEAACLRLAETRDFVEYGFEPEFAGRLPVRVVCDPLEVEDLENILLHAEESILKQYRDDFRAYGIEFQITHEAVRRVAELAHAEKTGARGLATVLERIFRDFKFELPDAGIASFEIDREAVDEPRQALERLLRSQHSARREVLRRDLLALAEAWSREHGLTLVLEEDAVTSLIDLSLESGRSVRTIWNTKFRDLAYALKLVARAKGQTSFSIGASMVRDPEEEMSRMITTAFRETGAGAAPTGAAS